MEKASGARGERDLDGFPFTATTVSKPSPTKDSLFVEAQVNGRLAKAMIDKRATQVCHSGGCEETQTEVVQGKGFCKSF